MDLKQGPESPGYEVPAGPQIFHKGHRPSANPRLGGKTRYLTYYTKFCFEKGQTLDLNAPKPF